MYSWSRVPAHHHCGNKQTWWATARYAIWSHPTSGLPFLILHPATTSIVTEPVIAGLALLSVMVNVSVPTTVPTATWNVAMPLVIESVAGTLTVTPAEVVAVTVGVPV